MDTKIIELLSNADFKKWVMNPTEKQHVYWRKWLDSHPDYQIPALRAKEIILRLKFTETHLSEKEKDEILDKIIAVPSQYNRKSINKEKLWYAVAAAIALIVLSFVGLYNQFTEEKSIGTALQNNDLITRLNPAGIKSQIKLSDGTKVYLNSKSQLIFPAHFTEKQRIVQLAGEAFFEVAEDTLHPFTVVAADIATTALGTSFNVQAYADNKQVKVALVSGKVLVKSEVEGGEEVKLNPGEKLTIHKELNTSKISNFNLLLETGWKDGLLVFKNANLQDFIYKVELWYGVNIRIAGTPASTWNLEGYFENESLEEILKSVSYTHDINFELDGKEVLLKFN